MSGPCVEEYVALRGRMKNTNTASAKAVLAVRMEAEVGVFD